MMHLKIKPLNETVRRYYEDHGHFHDGDAGLDLYCPEKLVFAPGETKPIKLGIACETAENKPYWLISRSSISKTPLRMCNAIGLIDAGYRGEIMAYCDNIKEEPYVVKEGQRLFQLVAMDGSPIHYELVEELSDTTRGIGGFGSTGR
ncbi:MAG: Deoxyuridine 5'-triphosphate nucleotidohydrolase [Candidatus Marinimicrobia bacterium]|nr:Deoxyuridine 5'-triphosphate nucleotidohydrolase [Candidatus Neomarinimicrobiota bacterium]